MVTLSLSLSRWPDLRPLVIFEQGNLYEKRSTASAAGRRLTVLERLELASDGDWHASEQSRGAAGICGNQRPAAWQIDGFAAQCSEEH